jgi:NTE family protein
MREFFSGVPREDTPEELWIVRINPQQWPEAPSTRADIVDRENEMMGDLSLNKELDFVLTVNGMIDNYGGQLANDHKPVTVRTIKMTEKTADELRLVEVRPQPQVHQSTARRGHRGRARVAQSLA